MQQVIKRNRAEFIALYVLILLVLLVKFFTLVNFKFTGSDDLIYWQCLVDYSNGVFHEPFFYGQNYNFAFESFLAIPLYKMGMPVYYALPLISTVIGAFPYFLFAIVLFKRGFVINAYLFLLILLTLPIEYDIITSLTRGFTSGLFFCSFLVFPVLKPTGWRSFLILGLSVSFAYILNPNSLIFSFPICLYLWFINVKNPYFYLISLVSTVPAFLILYFSELFYVQNPEHLVHSMWNLDFSWLRLQNGLSHLDKFFQYLTPIFWSGHWLIVALILGLGVIALKNNWKKGICIIFSALFVIIIIGVNKIGDDLGVIFLSSTRMFLGVPLLLGLTILWAKSDFINVEKWRIVILAIAASLFLVKKSDLQLVIKEHTAIENFGSIAIKKLENLEEECAEIKDLSTKHNVDLIVFIPEGDLNVPSLEFYNYGCSILNEELATSVMNVYERRTWVYEQEKHSKRNNVLLFNKNLSNIDECRKFVDCEVLKDNPTILLIRNNEKSLIELSEIFNFSLKRNGY